MVVVFYLQDWNKGINDPPEAENYSPHEVDVKSHAQHGGCFLFAEQEQGDQ